LTQTRHPGHACSHQDLLFPRPEELKFSSNPLVRSSQHPQNALYDLPLVLSGNRTSRDRESCTHRFGYYKAPIPDESSPTVSLSLIGNSPIRKLALARSRITHLVDPRFPICNGTLNSLAPSI
jgi:hypothetical protein